MITETFDDRSQAIINPQVKESAPQVDACILTFSHEIESFVLKNYNCQRIASFWFATGETPIYRVDYKEKIRLLQNVCGSTCVCCFGGRYAIGDPDGSLYRIWRCRLPEQGDRAWKGDGAHTGMAGRRYVLSLCAGLRVYYSKKC